MRGKKIYRFVTFSLRLRDDEMMMKFDGNAKKTVSIKIAFGDGWICLKSV